jgi:hypothetical protein
MRDAYYFMILVVNRLQYRAHELVVGSTWTCKPSWTHWGSGSMVRKGEIVLSVKILGLSGT